MAIGSGRAGAVVESEIPHLETVGSIGLVSALSESRCDNCHDYWNRTCDSCSRCGSPKFTPCLHCDFDLRHTRGWT